MSSSRPKLRRRSQLRVSPLADTRPAAGGPQVPDSWSEAWRARTRDEPAAAAVVQPRTYRPRPVSPLLKNLPSRSRRPPPEVEATSRDGRTVEPEEQQPEEEPSKPKPPTDRYVAQHVELFDGSEYEIPNSQAQPPEREVYWDMDTPETIKYRDYLLSRASGTDSPEVARPLSAPRARLLPGRRLLPPSRQEVRAGQEALDQAMALCREDDEAKVEHQEQDIEEEDMFDEDSFNEADTGYGSVAEVNKDDVIKGEVSLVDFNDDFDDGDDSLLVAASQCLEDKVKEEVVKSKPAPVCLALARLQCEPDGFGSDDSFDEQLSQMEEQELGPASPLLGRRSASKGPASVLAEIQPNLARPVGSSTSTSFKSWSSYDDTPTKESKILLKRVRSSPAVPEQPLRCGKDEIARKKREALAKVEERRRAREEREREAASEREKVEREKKAGREKEEAREREAVREREETARRTRELMDRKRQEALQRRARSQASQQQGGR